MQSTLTGRVSRCLVILTIGWSGYGGWSDHAAAQTDEAPGGLAARIAHLEYHRQQVAERAKALSTTASEADLLAEAERHIANTLQDLRRRATSVGPSNIELPPPRERMLLAAQLEQPADELVVETEADDAGPELTPGDAERPYRTFRQPPPPVERRRALQRNQDRDRNRDSLRDQVRDRREPAEPERRAAPGRFAPVRPDPSREPEGPPPRPGAEDREFHLRAAAHHLRMAGIDDMAMRILEQIERRRGPYAPPDRPTLPGMRDDQRMIPESRTIAAVSQRLNQRARQLEKHIDAVVDEVEDRVDDKIDDLRDRLEELEELLAEQGRRSAEVRRHPDRVQPADHRADLDADRDTPREYRDTVRRFNELLQGRPASTGDSTPDRIEREQLLEQADQLEKMLDNLRSVNARQKVEMTKARQVMEEQRHEANAMAQQAQQETEAALTKVKRLSQQLRKEIRQRMELQEKLSDMEQSGPRLLPDTSPGVR